MKIFISVDIEGVAGVFQKVQGQRGNPEYETARRLMTGEANAAIRGAFDAGATEVVVADSHGMMQNLLASDLDQRARLIQGKPRAVSMLHGLSPDFAGVLMIGYHVAAGGRGTLAHSISSLAFSEVRINGLRAGETALFGGHAAELGVPLLAVSGDDLLAEEVQAQFPDAKRIIVKRALGYSATDSLSPSVACELLERSVRTAVLGAQSKHPELPTAVPLETDLRLTSQSLADVVALLPEIERTDASTVRFTARSYAQLVDLMSAISVMAKGLG